MRNSLKTFSVVLLMLVFSMGWGEEAAKPEKDRGVKLFRRSAKMISDLKVGSAGKPTFLRQKQKIIRLLKRVVKLSNSEIQQNYIGAFIKCLKDETFDRIPEAVFIPETARDLIINYNEENKSLSAIVYKTSLEETRKISELFNKLRIEIKKGILQRNIRFFPETNVIKISEAVFPEDLSESHRVIKGSGTYPGVILSKKVNMQAFEERIKPLAERIIKKKDGVVLSPGAYLRNIFLHHMAHYMIPFVIKADEEKRMFSAAGLKELLPSAEEIRADLSYLRLVSLMAEKEYIEKGIKEEVAYTFLIQRLAEIKEKKGEGKGASSSAAINFLYKKGAIQTNTESSKLVVNIDVLFRAIKSLENTFEEFFQQGNYDECKAFFKKNSESQEKIEKLLNITPAVQPE